MIRSFSSSEDAHMARMRLGNAGIHAEVFDEATASVTPHIAFASGIRLMVADEDVARSREILGLRTAMRTEPAIRRSGIPWWAFAVAGVAVFTLLIQAIHERSARPLADESVEVDRNEDGKTDQRIDYKNGAISKIWIDNNFDSRWDVRSEYEKDIIVLTEADLNFDGDFDSTTKYQHGIRVEETIRDGAKGKTITRHTFRKGVLSHTQQDTDGNGILNLTIDYDPYGRELERRD